MTPGYTSSSASAVKPSKIAPFKCSWSAHQKVRLFAAAEPTKDTALTLCKWNEMRDPDGAPILRLEGDHFELEHHGKGQLPQDSFCFLDGLEIYILPPALERLRGKKLVTTIYHFGKRSVFTLFFPPCRMELFKTEPA